MTDSPIFVHEQMTESRGVEQTRRTSRWLYVVLWVLVAALFLVIRVTAFVHMGRTIYGRQVLLDSEWYYEQALRVAHGHLQEPHAFFFGPGWPYLLGAFYALTGTDSIAAGRVLNTLLSAVTLLCLAWCGKQVGGKSLALAAGFAWALYGLAALYEQTLLLESSAACMLAVLMVIWLYACDKLEAASPLITLRRVILTGIAVGFSAGLAALFRANILATIPVLMGVFGWLVYSKGASPNRIRFFRSVVGVGALCLGWAIAIAPAAWHNYRAERVIVPISSNFGINLWVGLGPQANGRYVMTPSNGNTDARGSVAPRQELKRDVNSAEISAYWTSKTLPNLTFARVTSLTWTKLRLLFQFQETPQIYSPERMIPEILPHPFPYLAGGCYMMFLFLGIAILIAERKPSHVALGLGAVAIVLSLLPFFVVDRYRLAASPWFLLVSLAGIAGVARLLVSRAWCRGALLLLFIIPGCVGVLWPVELPDVKTHFMGQLAILQLKEGNSPEALSLIRSVNATQPSALTLSTEASILEQYQHDYAGAAEIYDKAAAMAPLSAALRFNAAQAHLRINHKDRAMALLKEALELDPELPASAWYNLALLEEQTGDLPGAKAAAQKAAQGEPGNQMYENLAQRLGK